MELTELNMGYGKMDQHLTLHIRPIGIIAVFLLKLKTQKNVLFDISVSLIYITAVAVPEKASPFLYFDLK